MHANRVEKRARNAATFTPFVADVRPLLGCPPMDRALSISFAVQRPELWLNLTEARAAADSTCLKRSFVAYVDQKAECTSPSPTRVVTIGDKKTAVVIQAAMAEPTAATTWAMIPTAAFKLKVSLQRGGAKEWIAAFSVAHRSFLTSAVIDVPAR